MEAKRTTAILDTVLSGNRLTDEDAVTLLVEGDILALGYAAHTLRERMHPDKIVTYIVDRNINYTNVCTSGCLFCAFYRTDGDGEGYVIELDLLDKKIEELKAAGGIQILLQGGLHPDFTIEWYEELIEGISTRHPDIHIHAFSGPEIVHIAQMSDLSIRETIARLKDAGLDSIPGGGAEILVDRVRDKISPNKCSADQWLEVMETAHSLGMRTTATMMFGHAESVAERVASMSKLRGLQDKTGGFTAFIPWPFQPDNTAMDSIAKIGGHGYLAQLAVSRLYFDNIDNIQASWVTQGPKVAQVSLTFGANDMGSVMLEENVVAAANVSFRLSENDLRKIIEGAGYRPVRRNMTYEPVE